MTTIVGGVLPHGIVFASDTRTSDNEINQYWESRVTPKVREVEEVSGVSSINENFRLFRKYLASSFSQ